jgi:hypothetical protein
MGSGFLTLSAMSTSSNQTTAPADPADSGPGALAKDAAVVAVEMLRVLSAELPPARLGCPRRSHLAGGG